MKIRTRIERKIVGSDYSAQEPRMTAFLSDEFKDFDNPFYDPEKPSDDETFTNTKKCLNKAKTSYEKGLDLYAMIAQSAFNNDYWDNMEHYKEGTEIEIEGKKVVCGHKTHINVQGKGRRKIGKVLNLAATYGMSGATAGEKMNKTPEEGQQLLDNFFKGFPATYVAIEESKKFLKEKGYVVGLLGRRRHLPWVNDPDYEVKSLDNQVTYNPFLICNKPKPESAAVKFWTKVVTMYQYAQNDYSHSSDPDWEEKLELSNSTYEWLAKLAANPHLLDKPCQAFSKIEETKKRKGKTKDFAKFCRHSYSIKHAQDRTTLEDFVYLAYSLEKTAQGDPIIMTNREKLISDINEYNNFNVAYRFAPEVALSAQAVAPSEPVLIQANTGRKAQAMRQCFNARIQGSAATLTKLAMIDIANDEQMNQMQAKLIIPVHDELLVECPAFYAAQVEKRLPELMVGAAKKANDPVPQACDPDTSSRWYSHEMAAHLLDDYKSLLAGNSKKNIPPVSHDAAVSKILEENSEFPAEAIIAVLTGETDDLVFD